MSERSSDQVSKKLSRYHTVTQGSSEAVSHLNTICAHDTTSGPGHPAERGRYDDNLKQHVYTAKHEGAFKNNAGAGLPSLHHPHHHGSGPIQTARTKQGFRHGLSLDIAREEAKRSLMNVAKQIHEKDKLKRDERQAFQAFNNTPERQPLRRQGSVVNEDNRTHYQRFLRD